MNRVAIVAAACAVAWGTAAPAATIVQTDMRSSDRGFAYFDSALGTLQSVTLDITPNFRRRFQIILPGNVQNTTITWDASGEQFCTQVECTNLVAQGEATLSLVQVFAPFFGFEDGASYGFIDVTFTGATVSAGSLNPALFVNPPTPTSRRYLAEPLASFTDESLSDIFQIEGGGIARNATRSICPTSTGGGCENSLYRLTYDYIPAGSVPEPSTWVMMIVGFGMIGAGLRRRRLTSRDAQSPLRRPST